MDAPLVDVAEEGLFSVGVCAEGDASEVVLDMVKVVEGCGRCLVDVCLVGIAVCDGEDCELRDVVDAVEAVGSDLGGAETSSSLLTSVLECTR